MKKIWTIFLLIFLVSCAKNIDPNLKEIYIKTWNGDVKVFVEIADDNSERVKGLMYREKLDENSGMVFVFEQESDVSFWMKNTLIPLDIIFIDKSFKIVDIKNAVPCKNDPCPLYRPKSPVLYVLEVNEGFAKSHGIGINDKVDMDYALIDS